MLSIKKTINEYRSKQYGVHTRYLDIILFVRALSADNKNSFRAFRLGIIFL